MQVRRFYHTRFTRRFHIVSRESRHGVTVVEILVVMVVIGVLVALLLPAVQNARESARRIQCRNNLRQLGEAMHLHESRYGRFPSNGWGYLWVGDPDRGTDKAQPGGWIYNLLPDSEQASLRKINAGLSAVQRRQAMSTVLGTPLALLTCPSRPTSGTGPAGPLFQPRNANSTPTVAKTDYAVNEGDYITDTDAGPPSTDVGDDPLYPWTDVSQATGICYLRSETRFRDITDGSSQTYLLGEKHVNRQSYSTSDDAGYDQSMYSGVDLDISRWAIDPPLQDSTANNDRQFGSAHAQACHMLFCDGAVKAISYSIDREVHRRLGNRRDGQIVTRP